MNMVSATKDLYRRATEAFEAMRLGAAMYFANPEDTIVGVDEGYAEMTIDRDGNPLRTVRRETGSDLTVVSERGSDGSWKTHSFAYLQGPDGELEKVINPPTVFQFTPIRE